MGGGDGGQQEDGCVDHGGVAAGDCVETLIPVNPFKGCPDCPVAGQETGECDQNRIVMHSHQPSIHHSIVLQCDTIQF